MTRVLETLIRPGTESRPGSPVLVALHGRGADMNDLQGLGSHLPSDVTLVTPQAPFPGLPWGYGPGWAWYRYAGDDRVAQETLERSLTELDAFLGELPGKLPHPPGSLFLGGFSQGGTMALRWALERPGSVAGVVMLSGFLIGSPSLPTKLEASRGLRLFWSHGEADPAIPFSLGERGRSALKAAGVEVESWDHPGGHWIPPEAMAALSAWFRAAPEAGPPWPGVRPG